MQNLRFTWENHAFTIGVSVGVVPITAQARNPATLLMPADAVCYCRQE